MVTVVDDKFEVGVPDWVSDLEAFRRWVETDAFPEQGRIWWLKGGVWIDMSKEQLFSHILLKTKIAFTLTGEVEQGQLGVFFGDGALLSNFAADISGNPDGVFVSTRTLQSERVRLIEGKEGGHVELQGSPDMALEVISTSSVKKDAVVLKKAYWEAGVREYWLVDARSQPLQFDIFRHTARGYVAARKQDGWVQSRVFGKWFQLTQRAGPAGHPNYTLDVR
jgi:Uma2 family endonuclease